MYCLLFVQLCQRTKATAWKEYKTEDGKAYYHNTVTGATQWEMPAELKTLATDQLEAAKANLPAVGME